MDWEVCAHGFGLADAPVVDTDGSLLFSDVLGGGVHRLTSSGAVEVVVPKRRGVGGLARHASGGLVCSGRDVVHVREGESRTVVHVDGVAGWNDLTTDEAGRVYAGALRFAVFDPEADVVPGELWIVDLDGGPAPLVDDIVHANGVAVAPDQSTLYLSDTRSRRLVIFDLLTKSRRDVDVRAFGHPDGMAVDEAGCAWVALVSGGIGRFTPTGDLDRRIDTPSNFTTSLCFAGRDVFVTTGSHDTQPELGGCVLRGQLDVAGAPVFPARV
jgi:D-xylonolactonase